jgi:non-specific serine/threonine protein kinase
MRRTGDSWTIEHAARTFQLKDVRGLGMLARLVENPDREIHALDLASDAIASGSIDMGDAGEILDARARDSYKRRVAELEEEIEEAERLGDEGRFGKKRDELEALMDQLHAAVGLGGRERRTGSAAERARVTVQRRVREAIKKIADQDAELGRHLEWTVRTGAFCSYEPNGRKR